MINIQGYKGVVELNQAMSYGPKKGWQTTRAWRGPLKEIQKLAVAIQKSYETSVVMTIEPEDAGIATLNVDFDDAQDGNNEECSDGQPCPDSDVWSLGGSDLNLSLWSHPRLKNLAVNFPTEYSWLRKSLKAIESNQTWVEVISAYTAVGPQHDEVRLILDMMMNGVESYRKSVWVLKRTRTVSWSGEGEIAMANINRIFDYQDLVDKEGLPNELKFGVDQSLQWLKTTPTISMNGQKIVVENSYTGADDWNTDLYYMAA